MHECGKGRSALTRTTPGRSHQGRYQPPRALLLRDRRHRRRTVEACQEGKGPSGPSAHSQFSQLKPQVVFHCQACLPGGRAYRAAGWYADALEKRGLPTDGVYYLEGGIKAWKEKYGEDEALSVKLKVLEE